MQTITNMQMYRAIVVKSGIGLYIKSGGTILPSRDWTPTRMLKAATEITGKPFRRGQHFEAFVALGQWLEIAKLKGETLQDVKPMI